MLNISSNVQKRKIHNFTESYSTIDFICLSVVTTSSEVSDVTPENKEVYFR